MEWLTRLNSQLIGLDTSPLIYFIEQNPTYTRDSEFRIINFRSANHLKQLIDSVNLLNSNVLKKG